MNKTMKNFGLTTGVLLMATAVVPVMGANNVYASGTTTGQTKSLTTASTAIGKIYMTTDNLNLRTGASTKYGVILTIPKGKTVNFISESTNGWYKVSYGGKTGYVSSAYLKFVVQQFHKSTAYDLTLNEMVTKQFQLNAQTDAYRNDSAYVRKEYVVKAKPTDTFGVLKVDSPVVNGTTKHTFGMLKAKDKVTITGETTNYYKINYQVWRNAFAEDIQKNVDPLAFAKGTPEYFQFLDLSLSANVSATEMNKVVAGKGILNNQGRAFIEAGEIQGVNEVYLVSHALLETGNGTSKLANGVIVSEVDGVAVPPMKVYNMFGIGAYDATALQSGSERAYKEGWTTPEKAIIGGAKFIGEKYVNHPVYKQNTLYKMRWNPENPGTHQYATDIGWAVKQTKSIQALYAQLDEYSLAFDVPVYQK